jgi:hypothetical protein
LPLVLLVEVIRTLKLYNKLAKKQYKLRTKSGII